MIILTYKDWGDDPHDTIIGVAEDHNKSIDMVMEYFGDVKYMEDNGGYFFVVFYEGRAKFVNKTECQLNQVVKE